MSVKTIRVTKHPLPMPQARLVQGDANTQQLKFLIDKDYGGTDLSGLVWSVWVLGERGEAEVSYIGLGTVSGDDIVLTWNVIAAAAKDPGITELKLMGSNAGSSDTEYAWVSGKILLNVAPVSPIDPDYDEDEIAEVRQLITDIGGEESTLKAYTDTSTDAALTTAKAYTDTSTATALTAAKAYTDTSVESFTNRNLLDNWYFVNPVNQRGQTSYTGNVFGIDRWNNVNSSLAIDLTDSGLKLNATGNFYYECFIPYADIEGILGKQVTISMLTADGQLATGTGIAPSAIPDSTDKNTVIYSTYISSARFRLSFEYAHQDCCIAMISGSEESNGLVIAAVKVELGDRQTLAHKEGDIWVLNEIPDYGEQLRKCQRYFYRNYAANETLIYHNAGMMAIAANSNYAMCAAPFPVEMAARPTVTLDNVQTIGSSTAVTTTGYGQTSKGLSYISSNGAFVAGTPYYIKFTAYVSNYGG